MTNEKRLIDADVVMHKINAFAASVVYRGSDLMFTGKDSCNPHEYTRGYEQGVLDAQKLLGGQPTVDAVEVVRCKDCEFWKSAWKSCPMSDDTWSACCSNDFCSRGKRKANK